MGNQEDVHVIQHDMSQTWTCLDCLTQVIGREALAVTGDLHVSLVNRSFVAPQDGGYASHPFPADHADFHLVITIGNCGGDAALYEDVFDPPIARMQLLRTGRSMASR